MNKKELKFLRDINMATLIALVIQATLIIGYYVIFLALAPFPHPSRSPNRLLAGDLSVIFWGGVVLMGSVIPLGLTVWFQIAKEKGIPSLRAAGVGLVCALLGSIAIRALFFYLGSSVRQVF
jgi:anaerobic dimethyl sulfoxide reductase subunit C (anchor subunit)